MSLCDCAVDMNRQAEEATNDDEWGPATKTMAAISDACRRPDESPRIMQVLHARLLSLTLIVVTSTPLDCCRSLLIDYYIDICWC